MKTLKTILLLVFWFAQGIHKNPAAAAAVAAFFSAGVSFTAVIGGILTSLFAFRGTQDQIGATLAVADNQIRATVLSANRQRWIDELRNEIARAIQLLQGMSDVFSKTPIDQKAVDLLRRDFVFSRAKISLLINPTEKDHQDLSQALNDAYDCVNNGDGAYRELFDRIANILETSQGILKKEWERVKTLK